MTYQYEERDSSAWENNANLGRTVYDTFIKDMYKSRQFKPTDGHNEIRILPPGSNWKVKKHFGLELYRHMSIGPRNGAYLCHDYEIMDSLIPGRQPGECPVCVANQHANKIGNRELGKILYPKPAILVWLVDRNAMEKGPMWWVMPPEKVHREIVLQAFDKKRQKSKPIDHPINGYDVYFEMEKTGDKKQFPSYSGLKFDSEPTPITEDSDKLNRYLVFIEEHSLPSILHYHKADYIAAQLHGMELDIPVKEEIQESDSQIKEVEIPWDLLPAQVNEKPVESIKKAAVNEKPVANSSVQQAVDALDKW